MQIITTFVINLNIRSMNREVVKLALQQKLGVWTSRGWGAVGGVGLTKDNFEKFFFFIQVYLFDILLKNF